MATALPASTLAARLSAPDDNAEASFNITCDECPGRGARKSPVVSIGVCNPNFDKVLIDQIKPIAGILAEKSIQYPATTVRTNPHFQGIESIVETHYQVPGPAFC